MSHVRHSIHWVCNLPSVATLKAQARGLLQRVWSRKSHLQRLGRIGCWSHRRGHLWKNLNYSWFRGPFHITVIRASTTFNQLLTLESYWIISVPYLCGQSTLVAELRAPWGFFSGSGGPTIFSDCNWDFSQQSGPILSFWQLREQVLHPVFISACVKSRKGEIQGKQVLVFFLKT